MRLGREQRYAEDERDDEHAKGCRSAHQELSPGRTTRVTASRAAPLDQRDPVKPAERSSAER
jgi:hypothetical protein